MERPNEKANSILARDSLLTLTLGPPAAAAGTISYLLRTPTANLVTVAAPGEGLLTPYLGSHYAAVWGTSFSTGLVSGAAAALVNAADDNTRHQIMFNDVQRALSNANAASSANGDLGAGCLDLIQATHYIHDNSRSDKAPLLMPRSDWRKAVGFSTIVGVSRSPKIKRPRHGGCPLMVSAFGAPR